MKLLLAAGFGVCALGVVAVGAAIPISETSFGNALLIAGVVILCTGLVLIGMGFAVRELSRVAKLLVEELRLAPPPRATGVVDPAIGRTPSAAETGRDAAPGSPPWVEEVAVRPKPRPAATAPLADPPPAPPADRPARRNLLFSSKRRDKAETDQSAAPPPTALEVEPKVSFESAWPSPARAGPTDAPARAEADGRVTMTEPVDAEPPAMPAEQPAADLPPGVTVVRSGTVDEMAYTYYSDGSIEAQLAGENPIRFPSLDALRTYVEQRK